VSNELNSCVECHRPAMLIETRRGRYIVRCTRCRRSLSKAGNYTKERAILWWNRFNPKEGS
jgi:uncharacterized C2H2 Zn-finger protein